MNTTAAQAYAAIAKRSALVPTWLTVQGAYDAALLFALSNQKLALAQLQAIHGEDGGVNETSRRRIARRES